MIFTSVADVVDHLHRVEVEVSPAMERMVGYQSDTWTQRSLLRSWGRWEGEWIMAGVLVPPSNSVYLDPLRGQLLAS